MSMSSISLVLRSPRSGRLEGRPQARPCQRPSFETPCCARLLVQKWKQNSRLAPPWRIAFRTQWSAPPVGNSGWGLRAANFARSD